MSREEQLMELTEEELRERLEGLRSERRRYKPGMYSGGQVFKPSGHIFKDYYEELGESPEPPGDIEAKYIRKLLQRGGYTRETARKELVRRIRERQEKGDYLGGL